MNLPSKALLHHNLVVPRQEKEGVRALNRSRHQRQNQRRTDWTVRTMPRYKPQHKHLMHDYCAAGHTDETSRSVVF